MMSTKAWPVARCRRAVALLVSTAGLLSGCASTTSVKRVPVPTSPICEPSAHAKILWAAHWRPDQKDVPEREKAAALGMATFFSESRCFASAAVQRLAETSPGSMAGAVAEAQPGYDRVVTIVVRELGPIVKIGTSLAIVEGGTEVVLDLAEHVPAAAVPHRTFTVEWRNGGAGVLKGVASLPKDMQAALAAALQPPQN